MIPKTLHFVWFGSELPALCQALIERARELHSGWEIKVWVEKEVRKLVCRMGTGLEGRLRHPSLTLSTKSDLARYHIIAEEGGIYLDTDFLLLRSLEPLRQHSLFGVFQQPGLVCSGVFGAVPKHPMFGKVFKHLRQADYGLSPERLAGPHMFSPICQAAAAREKSAALLPPESFLPVHYEEKRDLAVWLGRDLRQSYAVHLWAHSWGPGGGDGPGELLSRIGALLLNPTARVGRAVPSAPLQAEKVREIRRPPKSRGALRTARPTTEHPPSVRKVKRRKRRAPRRGARV